jgi:hypothetical protein
MKYLISAAVAAISITGLSAEGSEKSTTGFKYSRPIPLSLGFLPKFMTNQSVSEFHMAIEKNAGWVFDAGHKWLKPETKLGRLAYKHLIFPLVMGPLNKAIRITTDVYGKASRHQALGWETEYVGNNYETYAKNYFSMAGQNVGKSYKGMFTAVETIDAIPTKFEGTADKVSKRFVYATPDVDVTPIKEAIKKSLENEAVDANKVLLDKEVGDLLIGKEVGGQIKLSVVDGHLTPQGQVLTRAGGYNARMMHARDVEDTLWYEGGGHLAQLSNHSIAKLSVAIDGMLAYLMRHHKSGLYTDLGRILVAYDTMGIKLDPKNVALYSVFTFLGSAEFWGRFFEEADYTSNGDTYVKAPEIGGFRLPNLGYYFTTKGLSYQLTTGYRIGQEWFFPVAVEWVFKGPKDIFEFTLGVRKQFAWMGAYIHGEVVANFQESGYGGKVAVGIKPFDSFYADCGVRFDHIDTLEGERNMRVINNDDKWNASVFATVGVLF